MKKLCTLLWLFCMTAPVFSQADLAASAKLSPLTRHYLQALKTSPAQLPAGFIYKQVNGDMYVSALVKISDAGTASQSIPSVGAAIGTKAGSIWTVQVPVEKVAEFIMLPGISYIQLDEPVFPNLEMAKKTTRTDSVHQGIGLPMPYSGKDVIMGVIDFGFDYKHPTFYDTLGNAYRVKKVWELNSNGTPPAGYIYGHELADTNAIKAEDTDNPDQTHGTGVAGIAAGSGVGGPGSKYRGIAYESDMVFVCVRRDSIGPQWMQSGFSDFIDGIKYIFDYADAEGKPAVVNISWGSQSGPHDGTTLFNQACDNLSGPGKIIVMSAGNEGQERIHLSKTFTPSDTLLGTFLLFNPTHYKRTWVDVWGEQGKTFCVNVTLYSGNNAGSSTGTFCIDDQVHNTHLMAVNGTDSCLIEIITASSEFNGKPRVILNIFNKSADMVAVTVQSDDGTVHLWNEYYYYGYTQGYQCSFAGLGFPWATMGNTASTVSDMGAAQSVLLVGAYASKVSYTDINGISWSYSTYVQAHKLVPFSSRGPMADGRIKPDITAPGLTLATAFTSYDTTYTPTGDNSSQIVAGYLDPGSGRNYYYGEFTGTSASSPVAAGIVALMLQAAPTLTPQEVQNILAWTAIQDAHTGSLPVDGNNNWGHGKINAYGAMQHLLYSAGIPNFATKDMEGLLFPNPGDGNFTLDLNSTQSENLRLEVLTLTGSQVAAMNLQVNEGHHTYPLNLTHLPSGIYLVTMNTSGGAIVLKTIIR